MFNKEFEGQSAIVLGASSGFGGATALELAKNGLNIIGVHLDRRSTLQNAVDLKEKIEALGRKALFFNINALDEKKRAMVITEAKAANMGPIKVYLHSLAFGALKALTGESSLSSAQIEMTLNVMANSFVYWANDLEKAGLLSDKARLYAMTSAGSSKIWPSYGAVSAAKAALESYCRQLAVELAPRGIRCNAIMAGVTDTAALRKIPGNEAMIEHALKSNPAQRLTLPEDVAKSITALSSSYCDFVNGNTIRIDGGEFIV